MSIERTPPSAIGWPGRLVMKPNGELGKKWRSLGRGWQNRKPRPRWKNRTNERDAAINPSERASASCASQAGRMLCVDMQRMFAAGTDWKMPRLERVLPNVVAVAAAGPERTIFTSFIPAGRAGQGA